MLIHQSCIKKLNIPKVDDLFKIQICKFMYLFINCMLPESLMNIFTPNSGVHDYNVTTRFGNLSRFETGTSHFATSMVLSWAAHLETHTHSPHRLLVAWCIVIVLQYLHININYCSYSFIYTLLDAHIHFFSMGGFKDGKF